MRSVGKAMSTLVAAGMVTILVPTTAVSAGSEQPPAGSSVIGSAPRPDDRLVLRASAHGAAAIERLGDDLDRVARLNSMTVAELQDLLREDSTAWVHPTGRIYYVDEVPEGITPTAAAQAPYPYDQTFQLHSRPGSTKTIYLDFDGQTVTGTAWNGVGFLLPAGSHPAFSLDGDPTTFNNLERDAIQGVWQRVSEDYAPFDVDVTTADPGLSGLVQDFPGDHSFGTRALISPSASAIDTLCAGGCGGIAFIGTYGTGEGFYQPAWVFPQALSWDTKAIAEAVSHEVGHNLGLEHDGTAAQAYYEGHGAWAPIMGIAYDRPIGQWSKGEYAGANNTQDDLTVITENGLTAVPDDHGNTIAGATAVTAPDRTASGLIGNAGDKDVLAFPQGCSGPVTVTVTPAPTSPNLDVRLRILGADGSQLAMNDPVSSMSDYDVATGMGAASTVTAAAGTTLYAEVDGVGTAGTTGYSDYGSIGRYTISSTGCAVPESPTVAFQAATQSAGEGAGTVQMIVVRTGDTTSPTSVGYARTGGSATPGTDFTLTSGRLDFAAGETQKTVPITITDDSVEEELETVQVTLSAPASGTSLGTITTSTLAITDDDAPDGGQPDLLISKVKSGSYLGDDVYNLDGASQSTGYTAPRGRLRSLFVQVVNDGPTAEVITLLTTEAGKGASITYSNNGNDITKFMKSGTAQAELAPGEYALIRIDLRTARRAAAGSMKTMSITATSADGVRSDVVSGWVRVSR